MHTPVFIKKRNNKSGLTLVETLVAISILLVVATATMGTAQKSLSASYASNDQITAFYLAQEANEYIRNTRDSNTLAKVNWDKNLSDCIGERCGIDTAFEPNLTSGGLIICNATNNNCQLKYDKDKNRYGHSTGTFSPFTRYMVLTRINSDEIRVDVVVEWKVGIRTRSLKVQSLIFNWS